MVELSKSSAEATEHSVGIGSPYQICTRCIYDSKVGGIEFDSQGVCSYCHMIESLEKSFKTATPEGEAELARLINEIKENGKGKKYDCIVGVSGGTDSSYLIHKAVEWGLRPLAVHYDNTWNSAIATENIRKVLGKLKVDLYTHVVDNKESDDIFRAFFLAGVPEIDGPTDIALAETMYRAAAKYNVRYVLEGHSFRAEGVSPLSAVYIDGKYIRSLHKRFGKLPMKTFPNMSFFAFMKWTLFYRIKKIRPYWYIDFSKAKAREFLEKEYGWSYYGGHHLENRMTAFNHSIYFPQKFGIDCRNNSLSACVRSGLMTRDEALEEYRRPPHIEPELLSYFRKRLNLTEEKYDEIMAGPIHSYREFPTYKPLFEKLRPLFYIMAKANLVPMSFYIKYTAKSHAPTLPKAKTSAALQVTS